WREYSCYVTYAGSEECHPSPTAKSQPLFARRLDAWIIARLDELIALANDRLEAYDVAALVDGVDRFVDDLSNWWLRRSRRRFSRAAEPADREAALSTLHTCLVTLARVFAPVMPFLAEEVYQNIVRSVDSSAPESVHLTPYPIADR